MSKKWKNKPQETNPAATQNTAPPASPVTRPIEPAPTPKAPQQEDWDSLAEESKFDAELDLGPTEARPAATQEPAEEPTEEEPAGKPAPPSQRHGYQHTDEILDLAFEVGISDGAASQYDPPTLLRLIDLRQAQHQRAQQRQQQKPESEDDIDWGVSDDGKKLTEKDWEPQVQRWKREEHARKKAEKEEKQKTQARLDAMEKYIQQQATTQAVNAFDRLFAEYPEVFGEGTVDEIDPKSDEAKARSTLWELSNGDPRRAKAAAKALYGKVLKKAPPKQEVKEQKQEAGLERSEATKKRWNDAALQKPSHREAEEPKGDLKAMKAAARWQRENGMVVDPFEGREESTLS